MTQNSKPWWAPIVHFAAHTTVGAVIFVIIAAPALALGAFVHNISHWMYAPPFTLKALELLEETVMVIDSVLFVAYLFKTAYHAVKEEF